jgi:hypothetical protein
MMTNKTAMMKKQIPFTDENKFVNRKHKTKQHLLRFIETLEAKKEIKDFRKALNE